MEKNELFGLYMYHLNLVDLVIHSSHKLVLSALDGKIDVLQFESENRDRLIHLLEQFQEKVLKGIDKRKYEMDQEELDVANLWGRETQAMINLIQYYDEKTTTILDGQKEETIEEIARMFKHKEQFRGYNLNDVKR